MTPRAESSFDGKVAIVTGASMGIGAGAVRELVRQRAKVVLVSRRSGPAVALVDELSSPDVVYQSGDVSNPETAEAAVGRAVDRFGRLDILINNAGIDHTSPLLDTPMRDARRVIDVNLLGAFWMLQEAGRVMRHGDGGSIVNVASRTGLVGVPTMGLYGASKAAVLSLTRSAAIELAGFGVRVNAVAPGITRTPLVEEWLAKQKERTAFEADITATIPQGRFAEPDEVVSAILYLASDAASYITGTTLAVDGGYTAA